MVAYNAKFKKALDKAAKPSTKKSKKSVQHADARKRHLAREVAAKLMGIHHNSLKNWHKDYCQGALAEPVARGNRRFDADRYKEAYAELLAWAEGYEAQMKAMGVGLTWQDIAKHALEDKDFAAFEKERQAIGQAARQALSTIDDDNEELNADPTSPVSLLNALGLGTTGSVDDPVLRALTFRLKNVLGKLGFGCEALVRENLKAIVGKVSWTTKFCISFFDFLTKPGEHVDRYLVWLDESFFYAGDAESKGIVSGGDGHLSEKGTYRWFGLLDALLFYWQPLPVTNDEVEKNYFARAEATPSNWFVREGHYLRCRKLADTALVWLAQKEKQKEEKTPKQAEQEGPGGDRLGTMNCQNFTNWWFVDRLLLFKEVLESTSRSELEAYLRGSAGELTEEQARDIEELAPLLGRSAFFVMDGATYHKGSNPYYVKRDGVGGLYGAGGAGRHNAKNGWTKDRCVWWLYLQQFQKKNVKEAMAYLEEAASGSDPNATAEYEHAQWLHGQDACTLRKMVDESPFASVTRRELQSIAEEYGLVVLWTPPHVGKYLNPIEILWSLVKARARRLPAVDRKNDGLLKAELRKQLVGISVEKDILLNICLPSMRFAFAVLKAVFEQDRLLHSRGKRGAAKPVLFAELFHACAEFGRRLGHDEVDEDADKGALPSDIELAPPDALFSEAMPEKIKSVPTWQQLQGLREEAMERQRGSTRIRALTSLKREELPAVVSDVLSSDESGASDVEPPSQPLGDAIGGGGEAMLLDDDTVLEMDVAGLTYKGCRVVKVEWVEHHGWWAVEWETEDGVEAEAIEPEAWRLHDVPQGSRWRSLAAPADAKRRRKAPGVERDAKAVQEAIAQPAIAKLRLAHAPRMPTRVADAGLRSRVAATMAKLASSRFRCNCGVGPSGEHGEKCKSRDRGGRVRHLGFDLGVSQSELEEAQKFHPKKKLR